MIESLLRMVIDCLDSFKRMYTKDWTVLMMTLNRIVYFWLRSSFTRQLAPNKVNRRKKLTSTKVGHGKASGREDANWTS